MLYQIMIINIKIVIVKIVDFRCIIHVIHIANLEKFICQKIMCLKILGKEIYIKNQVFDFYDSLIKPKKIETKNIVIDEKSCKDLVIYSTRYNHDKTIAVLSLYYHELMGKIKEHEGKNYLMVDHYILDKVLERI